MSAETLRSWRGLYKAALFETDASKLQLRIEEARRALVFRSRELFAASPNYDGETEAIENTLYALQLLENCLQLNKKDRRHASRGPQISATRYLTDRYSHDSQVEIGNFAQPKRPNQASSSIASAITPTRWPMPCRIIVILESQA